MAFVRGDEELTVQVFGYNDAVGSSGETIWPSGGFITIGEAGAPQTMTLTSASGATDNDVQIKVIGTNGSSWAAQEETVTLSGSGTATTSNTFARLNKAEVVGTQDLDGDVTIASTTNTTTRLVLDSAKGTGNCTYTVPWGYTGYIDSLNCTAQGTANVNLTVSIQPFVQGTGYVPKDKTRNFNFTGSYFRSFKDPVKVEQGSSIELQANASTSTGISADFVVLLDKN